MAHTIRHTHPDPKRIAGYTFAIAFNLGLLMLLLAPMQGPQGFRLPGVETPSISWYPPKPVPPATPPKVPVAPPTAQPAVAPVHRAVVAPQPPAVLVENGSEAAVAPDTPPVEVPPAIGTTGDIAPPVAGVALEYAAAPPPAYPSAARRMGHEGTVLLEVLVDVDGRPLRVDVRQSSGHRQLDDAAREQVLARWRFRPAMRDGRAIQAIGLVPVNFRLR
ncbi:MAG: energy transducer TonB [Luteimonas sp.]